MKITRRRIVELNHVLKTTEFDFPIKAKFRYMLTKNIKTTDDEIKAINEAFPIPDSVITVRNAEVELLRKFGIANPADAQKFEEEKRQAFEEEYSKFTEENASIFEEQRAYDREKMEFLNEEVDIDLKMVVVDDVPDISKNNKYPHWEIWSILETIVTE